MSKNDFIAASSKYQSRRRLCIYIALAWFGVVVILALAVGTLLDEKVGSDGYFRKGVFFLGLLPLVALPYFLKSARSDTDLACGSCKTPLTDGISSAVAIATGSCPRCGNKLFSG